MKKLKKILKRIAKQEGISTQEVYCEMQKAICMGYSNLNPAIQNKWREISALEEPPKPEDVINYYVQRFRLK